MTIKFTMGNLLDADAEALVNTVNTVGVMGKGIALMFKEAFPENFDAYEEACKRKEVRLGKMFVVERKMLTGPKWIINFPTKGHWRYPSQIGWIEEGLQDLKKVIVENGIRSIALPPLGSGNGGLDWADVRPKIEETLSSLSDVTVIVYEPTAQYQNVSKRSGVEKLTPARALMAELVRRYCILGIECTLLEVQKLAYFLDRSVNALELENNFRFKFAANRFGPYSQNLTFLLNGLDGSYLRLADAGPFDVIRFDYAKKDFVSAYLTTPDAKKYRPALEATATLIDGLESPFGMELLATVDWLVHREGADPSPQGVRKGLERWPGDKKAKERKLGLFDERVIGIALETLVSSPITSWKEDSAW
jgi:O-acetyl-ADP-ribose deacetylase (regulator of RNase III)